jgi:hypothetical protein
MISLVLLAGAELASVVPVSVPPEQAVTKKRLNPTISAFNFLLI